MPGAVPIVFAIFVSNVENVKFLCWRLTTARPAANQLELSAIWSTDDIVGIGRTDKASHCSTCSSRCRCSSRRGCRGRGSRWSCSSHRGRCCGRSGRSGGCGCCCRSRLPRHQRTRRSTIVDPRRVAISRDNVEGLSVFEIACASLKCRGIAFGLLATSIQTATDVAGAHRICKGSIVFDIVIWNALISIPSTARLIISTYTVVPYYKAAGRLFHSTMQPSHRSEDRRSGDNLHTSRRRQSRQTFPAPMMTSSSKFRHLCVHSRTSRWTQHSPCLHHRAERTTGCLVDPSRRTNHRLTGLYYI